MNMKGNLKKHERLSSITYYHFRKLSSEQASMAAKFLWVPWSTMGSAQSRGRAVHKTGCIWEPVYDIWE